MALFKFGESLELGSAHIQSANSVLLDPTIANRMSEDSEFLAKFRKCAAELKQIAPKAKDFLYFSAVMMHAAEASLFDKEGKIKKDASGNDVSVRWEKKGDSLRWICSDSSINPYRNSNRDIFPEEELIKAHKKWVGRPLCLDHKSSSVDMIRGVIVDTYYDLPRKRVIALCALDKVNYPDLARKVSTGYAASVSMGTAVGRAVCTDCGNVARVESDFCSHMLKKNCYGEINLDLNPIELSIVVNGADPEAKIKHIVAASNTSPSYEVMTNLITSYIDIKNEEFKKSAEDETQDIQLATEVSQGLDDMQSKLLELQQKVDQLKNNEEAEQKRHETNHEEAPVSTADSKDLMVKAAIDAAMNRIAELDNKINLLSKSREELEMTTKNAYFQGGGGVNEPTPGKPKYEKEDEDSIRANDDKQMGGQNDTGPVDGMHPGYDSFGESEEARKKRLLRASDEQQARALKREAALERAKNAIARNKEGYFQGAGGVNEPAPGKVKYPKEDADSTRDKEDKQQVGQAPFPGVGSVDGLHPSPASADVKDELKRKQMLARAALSAKFIKAAKSDGSLDMGESRWQVYANDKLILTTTVDELTGGKGDSQHLFDSIHSKAFGLELLNKIKTEGFEKAATFYKGGQVPPAGPAAPMPSSNDPFGGAPEAAPVDKGDKGDPKEVVTASINEMQNRLADLAQAWDSLQSAPANELKDFDQLAGGDEAGVATASEELQYKISAQRKVAAGLKIGIKQLATKLTDHVEELKLAENLLNDVELMKSASTDRKNSIQALVDDAVADSKGTLAQSYKLMESFCKYARATNVLVKQAQKEIEMKKQAQMLPGIGEQSPQVEKSLESLRPLQKGQVPPAPKPVKPVGHAPVAPVGESASGSVNMGVMSPEDRAKALNAGHLKGREPGAAVGIGAKNPAGLGAKVPSSHSGGLIGPGGSAAAQTAAQSIGNMADDGAEKDEDEDKDEGKDENDATVTKSDGTKIELNAEEAKEALASQFDLTTKEGRAGYRTKLAEKGIQYTDMIGKAHPQGGFTTDLDNKPSGDLAKVETEIEAQEKNLQIAHAPVKVRKMAEEIQKHVVAGNINPAIDFEGLVAQGLDSDAVKYWKQFYGEAKDGGSEFAASLIKDYGSKKHAEEQESYKVRVKRAYDLAYVMADKDLIGKDASSISTQVNEILDWSDANYESLKNLVARQPMSKKASAMPQVGMMGGEGVIIPAPEAEVSDLRSALEGMWSNSTRKF